MGGVGAILGDASAALGGMCMTTLHVSVCVSTTGRFKIH